MAPGLGNKRMQHLRALRVAQKLKREALAKEKEEEYLPKELVARVDVFEEEPEKENASDLDSDSEDSDEEDCKITDSEEQEPVQVNISTLGTLIAQQPEARCLRQYYLCISARTGAFEKNSSENPCGNESLEKQQIIPPHYIPSFRQFLANLQYLRLFLPLHVSLPTSANSRNSRRH